MPAESALIFEIPAAEPVVGEWRRAHDHSAALGIPAHVTVLYPFVSPAALDGEVVKAVEEVASGLPSFTLTFADISEFSGEVVYLAPSPAEVCREATERYVSRFPDHQPYGGAHEEVVPHLTVAQVTPDRFHEIRDAVQAAVAPLLPIRAHVTAVSLYVSDEHWVWRRRRRFTLGGPAG